MQDYIIPPTFDTASANVGGPPKPPSRSTWLLLILVVTSIYYAANNMSPGMVGGVVFFACVVPAAIELVRWVHAWGRYAFARSSGPRFNRFG